MDGKKGELVGIVKINGFFEEICGIRESVEENFAERADIVFVRRIKRNCVVFRGNNTNSRKQTTKKNTKIVLKVEGEGRWGSGEERGGGWCCGGTSWSHSSAALWI